jgi:hypothetical protein
VSYHIRSHIAEYRPDESQDKEKPQDLRKIHWGLLKLINDGNYSMSKKMIPSETSKKLSMDDKFIDDLSKQLSLAKKKNLNVITHQPTRLARLGTLLADAGWKEQLSELYAVLGGDPAGMAIAFNCKVKKMFGFSVTHEMNETQAYAITSVRLVAARVCADGIDHKLEKHVIIEKIWDVVEQIANSHKQLERLLK